jgi:hypothetical protein
MIDEIITQLDSAILNGKPLFREVEEAIDLATAMKGSLPKSPVAFVIEMNRRPGKNGRDMGPALQNVSTTIGIVIGISKRNDLSGLKAKAMADPILKETRKALFGFAPNGAEPMLLGAADTIGTTDHALWKLERFTTEHYEEASQ